MRLDRLGGLDVRVAGGTDREGAGAGPVVVLLHGFGAPGDDLVPLWRTLEAPPGTRFVFPAAPLALDGFSRGGRAWWWIDMEAAVRRRIGGVARDVDEVPEGLDSARAAVDELLDEVEKVLRPAPGKVVLGGFSQGAMLALDVALRSGRDLAGLVLMSGSQIAARQWAPRFEARRGLPVLMSHGRDDELLPYSVAEGLRDALVAHGWAVEWIPFRGGHGIPPNVLDAVGSFLNRVLG
jgi:phospholipase/carboxylesterase